MSMQRVTFYEREQIELYLRMGKDYRWIGRRLNRDHTVISREVERNSGNFSSYTAKVAQRIFNQRKERTNKRKLEKGRNLDLKNYVVGQLRLDLSPEQIAGRLKQGLASEIRQTISHESIYQYIYEGEGRFEYLYPHLRTRRSKRQRKFSRKKQGKIAIKERVSIHERPEIVTEKERLGDWETDSLIFSRQKGIVSVQYERKGMLCRLHKAANKTAEETEQAIWISIESLPSEFWQSLTRDNGTENVKHEETKRVFNVQSYFCDGYCSWQKGGVENLNKLIRQYLPRSTDLSKLTDDDIYQIQERLNNRPRKSLNYLTPNEVFAKYLKSGALNP